MFNGHKNYNHWNVSLWINNDERLYLLAKDCIRWSLNRSHAADLFLSMVGSHTPDGAPYSRSSVRAAFVGLEA